MEDTVPIPLTIVQKRKFWLVQLNMEGLKKLNLPKFLLLYNGYRRSVLHCIWFSWLPLFPPSAWELGSGQVGVFLLHCYQSNGSQNTGGPEIIAAICFHYPGWLTTHLVGSSEGWVCKMKKREVQGPMGSMQWQQKILSSAGAI